jgi:thiol-disulfide isomerase/thioredoxin
MGCKIIHYEMKPTMNHDFTPVANHLKSGKPVFAIFYMVGCGPCEAARPEWNKLRQEQHKLPQHALLMEIDHELKHNLADSLGPAFYEIKRISSFPTITLLQKGTKMRPYEGRRMVQDFKKWIHEHTSQYAQNVPPTVVSDFTGDAEKYVAKKVKASQKKKKKGGNCRCKKTRRQKKWWWL